MSVSDRGSAMFVVYPLDFTFLIWSCKDVDMDWLALCCVDL